MARGMSMEEFRDALSSEARIENEELKKKLTELEESSNEEISNLKSLLKETQRQNKLLCNRCYVQCKGLLCLGCQIFNCVYQYTNEEIEKAAKYLQKNNINREEGYVEMTEYLMKLRESRIK